MRPIPFSLLLYLLFTSGSTLATIQAHTHPKNTSLHEPRDAPKDKSTPPKAPREEKYFHEPGWDAESGHYDKRYFRGKVPYEQHRPVLRHLIRSYLTTFKDLGAETWLAHGSLLGWWWNGRIMPWDYDVDVQVSVATLAWLGERFNRSVHEYEYDVDVLTGPPAADGSESVIGGNMGSNNGIGNGTEPKVKKSYLLDINPYYVALTKGNGANVIDARWIDMSNGMFIDITGLRERDIEHAPGVWSCKNNHRYRTADLWPLRRTEFEGVEAWIPYDFDKVLTDEYGAKSLVKTEWAGHRWDPDLKEWIKLPKKPGKPKPKPKAKQKPKPKPKPKESKEPKRKEHHFIDENGVENVIVFEEVVVEV